MGYRLLSIVHLMVLLIVEKFFFFGSMCVKALGVTRGMVARASYHDPVILAHLWFVRYANKDQIVAFIKRSI